MLVMLVPIPFSASATGSSTTLMSKYFCHHADPDGQARVGVLFTAARWTGEPVNAEPGKCSEISWHDLSDLPADIVSYIRAGLLAYTRNDAFSLDGWPALA